MNWIKVAAVSAVALMTVDSFAQYGRGSHRRIGQGAERQRHTLEFYGQKIQGQSIIKIKQKLKQQLGLVPANHELIRVKLIAKSKQGRAQAVLSVGGVQGYSQIIGGSPYNFRGNEGYTFERIQMQNPSNGSQGSWLLKLKGNIKIKSMVVITKPKRQQQRTIRIRMNENLKGQSSLMLKRKVKAQTGLSPRDFNLVSVQVVAKSKQGRGQVSLKVGHAVSMIKSVGGSPYDFHNNSNYTFDKVMLRNPAPGAQGPWQVLLKGNIKVKEVILVVKKKRGQLAGGGGNYGRRRGY